MKFRFIVPILFASLVVASCDIIENPKLEVETVSIQQRDIKLAPGESRELSFTITPISILTTDLDVDWLSTDPSIASVNGDGMLTGEKDGSCEIKVGVRRKSSIDSFVYDSVNVVVESPVIESIDSVSIFVEDELSLSEGESTRLSFVSEPAGAKLRDLEISWSSSKTSIASVSVSGLVKGIRKGTTTIELAVRKKNSTDNFVYDQLELVISEGEAPETGEIIYDAHGNMVIDFLAINDLHGSLSENDSEPGISKLSTAIKEKVAENPVNTYLINSGDAWQGSADSNITRGALVTEIMNELDFKSLTLGNHEFDWGTDVILQNKQFSNFPFLACNIVNKSETQKAGQTIYDTELADPYLVVENEQANLKIGIIGAIGEGITSSILSSAVENYTFENPINQLKKYSNILRNEKECDIIIFTYHAGGTSPGSTIMNEFAAYSDAVFTAHTHQLYNYTLTSQGRTVPCIQSLSNGQYLGNIELKYNPSTGAVTTGSYVGSERITPSAFTEDETIKEIYDFYYENYIKEVKEEVLVSSSASVSKAKILSFTLQEMLRKYQEIDPKIICAVHNDGGVRDSIPSGVITYGDVYKSLPFDNSLYVVDFGSRSSDVNYLTGYYSYVFQPGRSIADLTSGNGYKMVTISYCYEKLTYYLLNDYEITNDYPRDIVADALRVGRRF